MIPQQMETAYQCQLLIFPKDDLIKMVMVFEIKIEILAVKNGGLFSYLNSSWISHVGNPGKVFLQNLTRASIFNVHHHGKKEKCIKK